MFRLLIKRITNKSNQVKKYLSSSSSFRHSKAKQNHLKPILNKNAKWGLIWYRGEWNAGKNPRDLLMSPRLSSQHSIFVRFYPSPWKLHGVIWLQRPCSESDDEDAAVKESHSFTVALKINFDSESDSFRVSLVLELEKPRQMCQFHQFFCVWN